ncbi:MAG TPA: lytic transglycosylase domain-containing protein [Thioploca sp.]|nr:MAG: hypothetical protein B6247_00835 [Beggiatoa sp. 4572_84]RKZ63762.1 MAG: hypothetical protein DRR08_02595 [Gammaproteobacteria bacterium]HDN25526.1 lytic transglycosylase domain-containing protein [Thioploca sp.]
MRGLRTLLALIVPILFNLADISSVYASYTHSELREWARQAAIRYGVDVKLVFAIIQRESGWNTSAVSPGAGAIGLMQIMPSTGRGFCGLTWEQLFDPIKNINCGVRYFKAQLDRFGSVKQALCAYNAGPNRAKKGLKRCLKIRETRIYIAKVLEIWNKGKPYQERPYAFPQFFRSAKPVADKWFRNGYYKNNEWWRLLCQSIDFVYEKQGGKIPARTQSQKRSWRNILAATVNDIYQDNRALSKTKIKRKIIKACPKAHRVPKPVTPANYFSAKGLADNWFINTNYKSPSIWWTLVCRAIDVVYYREIGIIGQSAITPSQQKTWRKILGATVDDIYADDVRLKGNNAWAKYRIKSRILQGCSKSRSFWLESKIYLGHHRVPQSSTEPIFLLIGVQDLSWTSSIFSFDVNVRC